MLRIRIPKIIGWIRIRIRNLEFLIQALPQNLKEINYLFLSTDPNPVGFESLLTSRIQNRIRNYLQQFRIHNTASDLTVKLRRSKIENCTLVISVGCSIR